MEVFKAHEHPLTLKDLNPEYPHDIVYDDEYDLINNQSFQCKCILCFENITFYHRYYYKCDQCDYSLHQLCGELKTKLEHASHSEHSLTLLSDESQGWCDTCKSIPRFEQLRYNCSRCMFNMCLDCVMNEVQYHDIYHPSHQHPLIPMDKEVSARCDACGEEQNGIFYHCSKCPRSFIHNDCIFQAKRLLIEDATSKRFSHSHELILAYSFPKEDQDAKYNPPCKICDNSFSNYENRWVYKCEKCRYYVHLHCAILGRKPSSSGIDITSSNNNEDTVLHLPFPVPTYNKIIDFLFKEDNEMKLTHHGHPLIRVDTQGNDLGTSSKLTRSMLNELTKKNDALCNGCVRPIMKEMAHYKCQNNGCNFVLHDWCTRLPAELKDYKGHSQHTLNLFPTAPHNDLGVFRCNACDCVCNGFTYSCQECSFYIDVTCAFIHKKIMHESHPHTLTRVDERHDQASCHVCLTGFTHYKEILLSCENCTNFYLHPECAFSFPRTIKHKYDKHEMTLTYSPSENHGGDYFCEICEDDLNPNVRYYHCGKCDQSMHPACAPLIPQNKKYIYDYALIASDVSSSVTMKFGSVHKITKHHPHPLTLLRGSKSDGNCSIPECDTKLNNYFILKCQECTFAVHIHHCWW